MIIGILIFSFYLEGILSKLITLNYLIPLTTLVSLIIIYPYLFNNKKNYYIICFIVGLLYDIVYTNTLLLNASVFLFIGYIISIIHDNIRLNMFNILFITTLIIILYRIIIYCVLIFIDYTTFNKIVLFKSIVNSLLFNNIYIIVIYNITNQISKKIGIYKKD